MSDDDGMGYALTYGMVSLNEVFVVKQERRRIFKKSSIRLTLLEMVWIGVSTFFSAMVLFGFVRLLSHVPIISDLVSWFVLLLAPVSGWLIGRRIARASPYRRSSGEGLSQYLMVQSDKKSFLMGRLFGRKVAVNKCVTYVSGRRQVVECIEWLGSARAPLAPKYDPEIDNETSDFINPPSSVPTAWAEEARQRQLVARRMEESWSA